ncbi:MAG: TlpA family protein disulfide reductase [Bacteroidetes bacterium]|nr:TlpA family protein disulfide reductase [Bacteroidota bacterium]
MKSTWFFLLLLCSGALWAQGGYEITVTLKPYKDQYIYLGHYFGKSYPIIDSVKVDQQSRGVFKGKQPLQGGIYLIGFPNKSGFFEILVDKQQQFSVTADSATLPNGITYTNSPDNELFARYQRMVSEKGMRINSLREVLKTAPTRADSTRLIDSLNALDIDLRNSRDRLIEENNGTFLASLLQAMREPVLPTELQQPTNREDSIKAFRYYRDHFWDGVNFWDGRLAYTTFFEEKLDRYFNQLVTPHPDSVNKEMDYMLGFASINPEMQRFLLLRFINRYYSQRYMWEDAVFVHLYEKYFSSKTYPWLSEQGKKTITDRAYSLMANILGTPATDIELPDSTGRTVSLYALQKQYTLVVFWDPTCGHCKETLPKIDSVYAARWKQDGVGIYAVAKETEGTRADWLRFIAEKKIGHWSHVYYSKEAEKNRVEKNVPGYSQLYDVQSFPTLYLLDKDKRIVAKKLSYEQMDEIIQLKKKEKQ